MVATVDQLRGRQEPNLRSVNARNGHQTYAEFCARVEAEFGEPAADVIRGMRDAGDSWATIAGALECSETVIRTAWAWRGGWADSKRAYLNHWDHGQGTIEARARALGYASLRQMLTDYYMAGKTRRDAAADLNCSPNSFATAIPGGLDLPPRPSTPAQLAHRRAHMQRINAERAARKAADRADRSTP